MSAGTSAAMVGSLVTPVAPGLVGGVVPLLPGVALFAQAARTNPPIATKASAPRKRDDRIRLLLSIAAEVVGPAVGSPFGRNLAYCLVERSPAPVWHTRRHGRAGAGRRRRAAPVRPGWRGLPVRHAGPGRDGEGHRGAALHRRALRPRGRMPVSGPGQSRLRGAVGRRRSP